MSGSNSVEISVPTDLTVTSEGDSEAGFIKSGASRRHARELQNLVSEKAELQKQVEKLKFELRSKEAQTSALIAQNERKKNLLNQQKDDLVCEKQIQINRLEGECTRYREDLEDIKSRAAKELAHLAKKCAVFQENQKRLSIKQDELRSSLSSLSLSPQEYDQLKLITPDRMTLQQFTSMRVYEMVWPLQTKLNEQTSIIASQKNLLSAKEVQISSKNEECESLKHNLEKCVNKLNEITQENYYLKDEKSTDEFRIRNFDRVKREREKYENELVDLKKNYNDLEIKFSTISKEKEFLTSKLTEFNLKCRKLEQDFSYISGELTEVRSKYDEADSEVKSLKHELSTEQKRSNQFHEKYLETVEKYSTTDFNLKDRLQDLNMLKEQLEISSSKEQVLTEEVIQLNLKLQHLSAECDEYKTKYENERKIYETDVKELKLNTNTLSKSRNDLINENSKYLQEIHKVKNEINIQKLKKDKEIFDLGQQLEKAKDILSRYEALDQEYNETIRTAASLPKHQADTVINKLMPGVSGPGLKALEKSVTLTRRILQLERENTESCRTIQQLTEGLDKLRRLVLSYKFALSKVNQPSAQLLQDIACQKDQIDALQAALKGNETQNEGICKENINIRKDLVKCRQNIIETNRQLHEVEDIKRCLSNLLHNFTTNLT